MTAIMIECCVRCLWILSYPAAGQLVPLFGKSEWACADEDKCAERQEENKRLHRREIERRLRAGKGVHTYLIVVQDVFGHQFGYGNYYVAVQPGEDPDKIAKRYSAKDMLVVESIIRIPWN